MQEYLRATEIIDWHHADIMARARQLTEGCGGDRIEIARRCFDWVRDHIQHSRDFNLNTVTLKASEVLAEGSGLCFAKAHLLAALLRANGMPAGLCYQRISLDGKGAPYYLHGLNAVYLDGIGWYRMDARGNSKPDVDAQCTPPLECLAYAIRVPGEADYHEIWPDPLPVVVERLSTCKTVKAVLADLPDMPVPSELGRVTSA